MAVKKLIEVALPLEKINSEAAREKSIRFGHPSTLHLWWARRPLAAARAVIWSSLVDDPSSHPELFPTEDDQIKERQRLFKILEELVNWENSNNPEVLSSAKKEILRSTNNRFPALLDPFAGGGSIPLEAQRLGLEAHGHDLNPVAVMINKAMIEIPPRFANMAAVNPKAYRITNEAWEGTRGLANDVRFYGEWIKKEAYKRIGHLYPKVKVPESHGGGEATVIAWIWARTVKCPNPACGREMPLAGSFILSKKKGNEAWINIANDSPMRFEVCYGPYDKALENGTKKGKKAVFCCPFCESGTVNGEYIDKEASKGRLGAVQLAVVAEGNNGRIFLSPGDNERILAEADYYYHAHSLDDKVPHEECRGTFASNAQGRRYGFFEFKDYFTRRQLIAMTTFNDLIDEAQRLIEKDALERGMPDDHICLSEGGKGALAYSEAVRVYLSFGMSRMANSNNSLCRWTINKTQVIPLFARQAIPIVWDYAENNVFNNAAGDITIALENVAKAIERLPANSNCGTALQFDAQEDSKLRNVVISTDPPYYDNIGYADLSDFFYVWLRKNLRNVYPKMFSTMVAPKKEELIATPYRHDGDEEKAKVFFEDGMVSACRKMYLAASDEYPLTIYYAYKQNDTDEIDEIQASSGWETMLKAIILSGFSITGTWPMRTEMENRAIASGTNALASSIVLVCRKRPEDAPICTRRNFINELKRELRPALQKLQSSNIAPVDLAQSAIGPGMGVYSKYSKVLEADGTPMSVRSALKIINQELDLYFNEQDGELDSESRFCVDLYSMVAFNDMKFGDANTLATAKGTSVAAMAAHGTVFAQKGVVHLVERPELPEKIKTDESCMWKLCQQLTYKMEKEGVEGCAKAIADMFGSNGERAKDLAYRLFTIAERKHWAQEAYAYNALVVAWPEIQSRAAQLKTAPVEQISLLDMLDNNDQN